MSKRQRLGADDYSSSPVSTRPRRGTTNKAPPTTIERSSPDETRTSSIRLTVKADPKKLKEVTGGAKGSIKINGRESLDGGEIVRGARSTRKKAIIESEPEDDDEEDEDEEAEDDEEQEVEEDEEDEEDAEGSDEEEDAEGEDEDEEMADDDEEDAEGEEDDEMEDAPPVVPKGKSSFSAPKPQVTITPAKPLPSVEAKEMAMDEDDDDELSSLDEDDELEGDATGLGDEEDDEEDDEDISRSATPDPSKLTRRQRAEAQGLMALSNEAQKKKHLTADEISFRRAEMARRRKALSLKRNDEEKQDTINRLLKRQASKRQRKADVEADRIAEEGEDVPVKASKVYSRYTQNVQGVTLGVPSEWVDNGYVGGMWGREGKAERRPWSGRMVEVVE